MTETLPEYDEQPTSRSDWILMVSRWLLAVGLLLLNRFSPPTLDAQSPVEYILLVYLLITGLEVVFLWRRWLPRVWSHITLAVDVILAVALLFLTGGTESPLLPLFLLPVMAISVRLGFSAGLGLNLAALVGYALLIVRDYAREAPPGPSQWGVFAGAIIMIAVFGGLIAEQMGRPAREEAHRLREQVEHFRSQYIGANKRALVLHDMASTLSVTMSYQRVLESILKDCRRLLEFSVGVVYLSAGEEDLYVAASTGLRADDAKKGVHLVGGCLSSSLATAEAALLEHLGRDLELRQTMALQRCRSGMCVPLRAGLRNYGAIVVGSMNENAYSKADLAQLAALARFATIAIQNAQLYQDLREERDKIISAEENVRKELSRDLHDGPAQSLAAIAMNVEYIKRLLKEEPDRVIGELDTLEGLARKTAWDVRTMLFELRPIILETQGLVPTLEQYVQRFPDTEPLKVHLDTGGFDQRLDPKVETTVFTIMQEAVNNARKHAKGKNIWLRLTQQGDKLVASVQDDGVGFDLKAIQSSYEKRGSFGLLNMQERAELIGGGTEIRSAQGKGTAVIITVPLKRE